MKPCNTCGKTLPLDAFYAHKRGAVGRMAKCKECHKASVRAWYDRTRDERSAYERRRSQTPDRKARLAKSLAERDPLKRRATYLTSNAIRDGRLVRQPCETCGAKEYIQAHHDDYSKPLEVRWLCFRCHRAYHGQTTVSAPTRGRHVVK